MKYPAAEDENLSTTTQTSIISQIKPFYTDFDYLEQKSKVILDPIFGRMYQKEDAYDPKDDRQRKPSSDEANTMKAYCVLFILERLNCFHWWLRRWCKREHTYYDHSRNRLFDSMIKFGSKKYYTFYMLSLAISYWNFKNEQTVKDFQQLVQYEFCELDDRKSDIHIQDNVSSSDGFTKDEAAVNPTCDKNINNDEIRVHMQMVSSGTFYHLAFLLTGCYYKYTQYPFYRNHKFLRDIEPVVMIMEYLVTNKFVFKLSTRDDASVPKVYLIQFYQILASIISVNKGKFFTIDYDQWLGTISMRGSSEHFPVVLSNVNLLHNIVTFDDCTSNGEINECSKILESSLDVSSIKYYQSLVIKLIKLMHQLMMKSISYHDVSKEPSYKYYEKLMCQYDRTKVKNNRFGWKEISNNNVELRIDFKQDDRLKKVVEQLDDIITHCLT